MSAMDDVQPHLPPKAALDPALNGARGLAATLGILILAALSWQFFDHTAGPPAPSGEPVVEQWKGNSGSLPYRAPVPPQFRDIN